MVMITARVATRMTASAARVSTAKTLPAVEALGSVAAAAMETLRPVSAAKRMEAARSRLLAGRLCVAPASKFREWPLPEIRTLKALCGCATGERRPVYGRRRVVVSLLRSAGVAKTRGLVTTAGVLR